MSVEAPAPPQASAETPDPTLETGYRSPDYEFAEAYAQEGSDQTPAINEIYNPEDAPHARESLALAQSQFEAATQDEIDRAVAYLGAYQKANEVSSEKNAERTKEIESLESELAKTQEEANKVKNAFAESQFTSKTHRALVSKEDKLYFKKRKLEKKNKKVAHKIHEKHTKGWTDEEKDSQVYGNVRVGADAIYTELAARKAIREEYNDPETSAERKAELEQKIRTWNGETDEQYRARQSEELQHGIAHNLLSKRQEARYEAAATELARRREVIKKLGETTDSAAWKKLDKERKGWEPIPELLGGDLIGFQNWIDQRASSKLAQDFANAASETESREKKLERKTVLEKEAAELHGKITEITTQLEGESDEDKKKDLTQAYEEASGKYKTLQEEHEAVAAEIKSWNNVSASDFYREAATKANAEFENRIKVWEL